MLRPRTLILGPTTLAAIVVAAIVAVVIGAIVARNGFLGPHVQKPRSDVPVIANIGAWPYQKDLRVEDLAVTVVDAPLNLFNNQALVRFRIKGRIKCDNGWRPFIKEVQLSQRLAGAPTTRPYGDFALVPVVDVKQDPKYAGDDVQFDVKVEQLVESLDWGPNHYVVVAGDKQAEFTLHQIK
jgi:hypothetical protein